MNHIKRFIVAAIILLSFLAVGIPQSAHAISYWLKSDGFESNPQAVWSCWQSSNDGNPPCQFLTDPLSAYQGNGSVFIAAGTSGNSQGWSDVGRYFTVDNAVWQLHKPLSCQASFYLRNRSSKFIYPDGNYDSSGRIEVIDASTWSYISMKPYTIYNRDTFTKITTASWTPPSQTFFVRVGVLYNHPDYSRGQVQVDNFSLSCVY